jgi:hypothetical protein
MIKLSALTCVVGLLACGVVIEGCATTGSESQAANANGAVYGTIQSIEMMPTVRTFTQTDADYLRVGRQVRVDGGRILR